MSERLHWFAFAFQEAKINRITTASAYIGYPDKVITMDRIVAAKTGAQVSADSVLLSFAYLGHMTRKEFTGEPEITETGND